MSCGCQNGIGLPGSSCQPVTVTVTAPIEVSPTKTQSANSELQNTLQDLLDRNWNLVNNVFVFSTLAISPDNPIDSDTSPIPVNRHGGTWYQADTILFPSFAALIAYVESTYTTDESDKLLTTWPNGEPLYKDINGVLCINLDWQPNTPVTVSWENYTFTYTQFDDNAIQLDVLATAYLTDDTAEPPYQNIEVPMHVYGTAFFENGQWKLLSMMIDNRDA